MKDKEKKTVLFIADERVGVHEHMEQIGSTWEKFTCSRDSNCYFCGIKKRSNYVEYSSVWDMTPYKTKEGKDRKYSKRAFPNYGASIEILNRRRQEKGGSLAGHYVDCFRDGEKTANVGNDFTIGEKIDLSKMLVSMAANPIDAKPFDFEEMLAPLSAAKIEAMLKHHAAKIETTSRSSIKNDEDIPF